MICAPAGHKMRVTTSMAAKLAESRLLLSVRKSGFSLQEIGRRGGRREQIGEVDKRCVVDKKTGQSRQCRKITK